MGAMYDLLPDGITLLLLITVKIVNHSRGMRPGYRCGESFFPVVTGLPYRFPY